MQEDGDPGVLCTLLAVNLTRIKNVTAAFTHSHYMTWH